MQANEMTRKVGLFKKAYALGVTVAPDSWEHFLEELRHVKEALLSWKKDRGAGCETVMFTIVCDPLLHSQIKGALSDIYAGEKDLSPILRPLRVLVSLLDVRGRPREEFELGSP
jgi:hypothetical protein